MSEKTKHTLILVAIAIVLLSVFAFSMMALSADAVAGSSNGFELAGDVCSAVCSN